MRTADYPCDSDIYIVTDQTKPERTGRQQKLALGQPHGARVTRAAAARQLSVLSVDVTFSV